MPPSRSADAAPSAGRLFVAAELEDGVRDALEAHLRSVASPMPGRPVPPRNWHFTLHFLGDVPADAAERLRDALRAAPLGPAFDVALGGLGAFPRPARATVLWVGVGEGREALSALAARVEEVSVSCGFSPERKPFSPHLTVARLRPPEDVRTRVGRAPAFGGRTRIGAATLFRSVLGGGPPRYEVVERFPLDGG